VHVSTALVAIRVSSRELSNHLDGAGGICNRCEVCNAVRDDPHYRPRPEACSGVAHSRSGMEATRLTNINGRKTSRWVQRRNKINVGKSSSA